MTIQTSTTGVQAPVSQTFGVGEDVLVLKVAQDYFRENVKFAVLVDGVQVGDVYTISSVYKTGAYDTFTLLGNWGDNGHKVSIKFLNGQYDAATGGDSNLAIVGASYNGVDFIGKVNKLWSTGSYDFMTDAVHKVTGTSGADKLYGGSGRDIITGGYGDDILSGGAGHDVFVAKRGDGREVITDFTVSGPDADVIRLSNYMIENFGDLKLRTSQQGKDTVLRLDANNAITLKNVDMTKLTAANFEFLNPVAKLQGVNLEAGTGKDTLVVKVTQDLFTGGNAQYTVAVDGVQVGGTFTASAVRMTGQQDTLTLHGNWAPGSHNVTITFLNDAFNTLTLEDRNLNIEGAKLNGVDISGASKLVTSKGAYTFTAAVLAPVAVAAAVVDTKQDVFSYTSGSGAKAIAGFSATGAGADVLKIDGYGLFNNATAKGAASYATFDDLKSTFTQVGTDTVIKLSSTDSVTLKGVKASELTEDNFSIISKIEGAKSWATNNGWVVLNNTWGSGDFTYGKDYTVAASYDPHAITSGTTFNWDYPPTMQYSWTKVLGYPSVLFGADTFNDAEGEFDPAHVLPVQIKNLDDFKTSFNVTQGGDVGGFDTSYDIWLTNKPNGIWSDITNEVMIWLHRGDAMGYGKEIGTYTDGNYSATIYHIDNYTALIPDKDYLAGTIDVKDVLQKLQAMGIVSPDEYVNQIDLGSEPFYGKGSLTINSLSYDVTSRDAAGIVTQSHADGGDTSIVKHGTAKGDVMTAGTAKIATLIGGDGNDTFLFKKGEVGAVTVQDFHAVSTGSVEHDLLKFEGYGSGATLVHDSGDAWSIHYTGGVDHITLQGVTSLTSSDYLFV